MSGHSKWSTIKRQKGANDAKRGQAFTKIAMAITVAARLGNSGDPESNPRLRMVLEAARAANMPKDNISRAIDKGLGKLPGQILEEAVYEGFGPGKVSFIVEAFSDNKQRTTSEIRNIFDRGGGSLGSPGVCAYMFDKVGEIHLIAKPGDLEQQQLELIDAGASDVEEYAESGEVQLLVTTTTQDLALVSTKVTQLGYNITSADLVMRPNITVKIDTSDLAKQVLAFLERLEDHQDVQKVFANFDIPDELID